MHLLQGCGRRRVFLARVYDFDNEAGVLSLQGGPGAIRADLCWVVLVDRDGVIATAAVAAAPSSRRSSCGAQTLASQTCMRQVCT